MDREALRAQLVERDRQWSELASSEGDVDEIVSFWTEDARVVPPGMPPIVGTDALREYVKGTREIPGFSISWTSDRVDVSEDGTMAWILGTNVVELDTPDGRVHSEGRVATVWRREADGEWRCCLDLWNEGPTA